MVKYTQYPHKVFASVGGNTVKKFYPTENMRFIMNKTELIAAVAAKTGLKKKDAEAAVAAVFATVADELAAGNKVQVIGFGTFEVKARAARNGKNPRTGEAITIPASKYPAFSAGGAMKASVNK